MFAIVIGAITVGVVQPFFRVLWTKKLNEIKKCQHEFKEEIEYEECLSCQ